jgi:hypothetical protein
MAKEGDLERLNHCLTTLDSTDLGLSLVWLWTWSTIKQAMDDDQYSFNYTELQVWDKLVESVKNGYGFSLEYGADQHYEDVTNWLLDNDIMTDLMFEEEEDEDDDN